MSAKEDLKMVGAFLLFSHLFFPPGDLIAAQTADCERLNVDESFINWLDRPTFLYPNIYPGHVKIEPSELPVFEDKWNLELQQRLWGLQCTVTKIGDSSFTADTSSISTYKLRYGTLSGLDFSADGYVTERSEIAPAGDFDKILFDQAKLHERESVSEFLTTSFLSLEDRPSSGIFRFAGALTECGMIFNARELRLIDPDKPAILGFVDVDGSLVPTEVFSFHAEGAFFR
jgi:hypothetical protein